MEITDEDVDAAEHTVDVIDDMAEMAKGHRELDEQQLVVLGLKLKGVVEAMKAIREVEGGGE